MHPPRPTHFLALPLHNHSTLRTRVQHFQHGLLNSSNPIPGLDPTIVIDPRRLHLTLGVMALASDTGGGGAHVMTIPAALDLLHSLRPSITQILNGSSSVKVGLDTIDVLKSHHHSLDGGVNAHVLFLGPERDEKLWNVCNLINQSFRSAGFITEMRPLKLHCTILNTSYRRPRSSVPFSYSDILANVLVDPPASSSSTAQAVHFGTYDVRRVELWEMGSHGPHNEYISCGGIDLG